NPLKPVVNFYPSNPSCIDSLILSSIVPGETHQWSCSGNQIVSDTLKLTSVGYFNVTVLAIDSFGCVSDPNNLSAEIHKPPKINFNDSVFNICTPGSQYITYTFSERYGMFTLLENGVLY